ncbi:MAG: glycosyltransferase [Candidatus Sumerlaeaceae bacterium]|nr:glycosyltransferase [Candidatus Sumerlaeaceae bacterium]
MDFSVIIPTYNRPARLAECLKALSSQDYTADGFEIIVVNDGGSREVESCLAGHSCPASIRILHEANLGAGAARNLGAKEARGRWLAFTDDDCRPQSGWLRGLAVVLEGDPEVMVGGEVVNGLPDSIYPSTSQLIHDAAYAYFNPDPARGHFVASNNMAMWREKYWAVGGFDPRFRPASEDRELCDRWLWRGGRIVWTHDAVVAHYHAMNFTGFVRQHLGYGRGAALFHRERSRRGTGRVWDDMAFRWRWRDLIFRPALKTPSPAATLAMVAVWQIANTVGFFHTTITWLWSPPADSPIEVARP